MQERKALVVNADDFGYCKCRSDGTMSCLYPNGMVTSVSVLVTLPFCPIDRLCVGLHFNITEGKPLCAPDEVPSLVDVNGEMRGKMGIRNSPPEPEDVERELEAQIKEFNRRYGFLPSHIDGHQHVHVLPFVAHVFARTLSRNKVRWTRLARQDVSQCSWVPPHLVKFFESVSKDSEDAAKVFRAEGVEFCEGFIGLSTQGGMCTEERILKALSSLPSNVKSVEWMVHPGDECVQHGDDFNRHNDRQYERDLLLSKTLRESIEAMGFQLVSFKDLGEK